MKRVAIVGGGLAGLSLASLLAQRGQAVTVFERDQWGGKLRLLPLADQKIASGPSLFTFPQVWHSFVARLGEAEPFELKPLTGGLGLYHTPYGSIPLPVPPEHPLFPDWQRYVQQVAPLQPAVLDLLTRPPQWRDHRFRGASARLFRVLRGHFTVLSWLRGQGLSPALSHALAAQALNAGVPPQGASALYALLPGLIGSEVYQPAGGMGTLLSALQAFAIARGVELRAGLAVSRLQGGRLLLENGEQHHFDRIVSAIDPQRLAALRGRPQPSPLPQRTVSGVALYAPLETPQLEITSTVQVRPPSDYDAFAHALRRAELPAEPLIMLHQYAEHLALLLTVPATGEALSWAHPWIQAQLERSRTLWPQLRGVNWKRATSLDPAFYALGGHSGGALYGQRWPWWRSGPLHPQPYRLGPRLWQVGLGVHPGGGLPGVLGSALIVDELLARV